MRKLVGSYELGFDTVRLFAVTGETAYFSLLPADGGTPLIELGMRTTTTAQLTARLLHEAIELALTRMDLRYSPSLDVARDNGSYLFCMTHTQFSEAIARAAEFVDACAIDLSDIKAEFND